MTGLIELIVNGETADLAAGTVVALTRQASSVADIESAQADFTNKFSLPTTQKNLRIFNLLGGINSASGVPYVAPTCKIKASGVEYVSNGILVVDSVGEFIEVSILSGNANFFEAIKDKSIRDLDLSSYDLSWTNLNVYTDRGSTSGVFWPIVDWGTLGPFNTISPVGINRTVDVRDIRPAIYLYTLVKEIVEQAGFSLTTFFSTISSSLTDYDIYEKLIIPYVSLRVGDLAQGKLRVSAYLMYRFYSYIGNDTITLAFGQSTHALAYDPYDIVNNDINSTYCLQIKEAGTYLITIIIQMYITAASGYNDITFNLIDRYSNVIDSTVLAAGSSGGKVVVISGAYYVEQGNALYVKAVFTSGAPGPFSVEFNGTNSGWQDPYDPATDASVMTIDALELSKVAYTWDVECAINLPDITQTQIMKLVSQMFCGIYITDPIAGTVDLFPFNELKSNKPTAPDWSDKLALSENYVLRFKTGDYARRNWLKYSPAGDDSSRFGNGYFDIADDSLPLEKTLLETKFVATETRTALIDVTVCYVNILSVNKGHVLSDEVDTGTYFSNNGRDWIAYVSGTHFGDICWYYDAAISGSNWDVEASHHNELEIEPRILAVNTHTANGTVLYWDSTITSYGDDDDTPSTYFIDDVLQSLDFQTFIDTYYGDFVSMLDNCKVINAFFKLSVHDVTGFDFTTPVWVEYFSSFFYVNKIISFIPGQLTEVELIKIS